MFCEYCGNELEDDALFCDACGKPVASEIVHETEAELSKGTESQDASSVADPIAETHRCPQCGNELEDDALFCEICGVLVSAVPSEEPQNEETIISSAEIAVPQETLVSTTETPAPTEETVVVVQTTMTTETEQTQNTVSNEETLSPVEIIASTSTETKAEPQPKYHAESFSVKNLFSQVFKSHSTEERAEILRAGIVKQDEIPRISSNDLQPWLYSRVLLILLLVFGIFEICLLSFDNSNMMPGIMLIGSLLMPFSILTMYFELNAYKDISFYSAIGIFLLGGAVSLLFTLFLYAVVPMGEEMNLLNASLISAVEEIGKAVVVVLLIKRNKNAGVLQGLLIGGAVGCGFAVFESAGYAFNVFLDAHDYNQKLDMYNSVVPWYYQMNGYADSLGEMNFNIFLRAILAFGGHTAWAAIEGAAFAKEKKTNADFLKIFAICFALHALWDTDTPAEWLKLIALCLVAWYVIIRQINGFINENNAQKSA